MIKVRLFWWLCRPETGRRAWRLEAVLERCKRSLARSWVPQAGQGRGQKAECPSGLQDQDRLCDDFLFEGTVSIVEALGEVTLLYVDDLTEDEPIIAKMPGHQKIKRGDRLRFTADKSKLHLFDAAGNSYRR